MLTADQTYFEGNFSNLETYYWRSHPYLGSFLPYNTYLTILVLIGNVFAAYSWSYADLFLVLCSRALYFKFKILVDQTSQKLLVNRDRNIVVGKCT